MVNRPVPTKIKRLKGNPGMRPLPKPGEEPEPAELVALGDPPDFLGSFGTKEWYRVGPVLIQLGLLTEADLMIFVAYCLNVNILVESQLDIDKNGMTIEGSRGPVRNPALATFAAATTALRSLAAEFGMTPSSRSRMRLPGDEGDTLEDLLNATEGDEDAA